MRYEAEGPRYGVRRMSQTISTPRSALLWSQSSLRTERIIADTITHNLSEVAAKAVLTSGRLLVEPSDILAALDQLHLGEAYDGLPEGLDEG